MIKSSIAALVILIVILGGFLFYKNKQGAEIVENDIPVVINASPNELLAQTASLKCTFAWGYGEQEKTTGVMYIADGKLRKDSITASPHIETGELIQSEYYMIVDDMVAYLWIHDALRGTKLPFTDKNFFGFGGPNAKFDYLCSAWEPDQDVFELPPEVNFVE